MTKRHLGVKDGKLSPCPSSPNCVSTQSQDPSKKMEPLPFIGTIEHTKQIVQTLIRSWDRSEIHANETDYMHVVFTSKLLKFKDDVEFYFDASESFIHFRSASRVGYSDFGVNRKRMEKFSEMYMDKYEEGNRL
ncbi:DUF1499 domain-containing protein [Thalassobacillus hwangdonensis]|uniref:DUF1499 domain-containing protein n=1 Tax=Thalassobacillus hwangdonensis TaxID=546108 RepID=A0ABW3KXG6_9BACI